MKRSKVEYFQTCSFQSPLFTVTKTLFFEHLQKQLEHMKLHGKWNELSGHILQQVVHWTLAPITSLLQAKYSKDYKRQRLWNNYDTAAPQLAVTTNISGIKSSMNKQASQFHDTMLQPMDADYQIVLPKPSHQSKRFKHIWNSVQTTIRKNGCRGSHSIIFPST